MNVVIFGGYGFIGKSLVKLLATKKGIDKIIIPIYGTNVNLSQKLAGLDGLQELIREDKLRAMSFSPVLDDILNNTSIDEIVKKGDVIINLTGILNQARSFAVQVIFAKMLASIKMPPPNKATANDKHKTFDYTHHHLPHQIAKAAGRHKKQLIHISAVGADASSSSKYLVSKSYGEHKISQVDGLDWTIIRPSIVIGKQASFVKQMRKIRKIMPLMFLPLALSKSQPLALSDLLFLIEEVIDESKQTKKTYNHKVLNAVGDREYSLGELVSTIAKPWLVIPMPRIMSVLLGYLAEMSMKNPVISTDNIRATKEYKKVTDNHLAKIKQAVKKEGLTDLAQELYQ